MHGNARLTPVGRLTLVVRIEAGRPVAHVAAEMGISRPTAYKWWRRWFGEALGGPRGSFQPARSCPHQTPRAVGAWIAVLRRRLKLGPRGSAGIVGVPASTVHRVLVRHGLEPSGVDGPAHRAGDPPYPHRPARRAGPLDIKKLGRIPDGGGWRAQAAARRSRAGHAGVGLRATSTPRSTPTAASPTARSTTPRTQIDLRRVPATRAHLVRRPRHHHRTRSSPTTAPATAASRGATSAPSSASPYPHPPYRPRTNGKVERFNRTLLDEWAYVRPYRRKPPHRALDRWLHLYNHHRAHTAIGGRTHERVNNLPGHYN